MRLHLGFTAALLWCLPLLVSGQEDTAYVEEDWSIYDDLEFADEGTKRFANAKVVGLSPAKFVTVGYDYQAPYEITAGAFDAGNTQYPEQTATARSTNGLRLEANIPVISKNNLIIQVGGRYWDINYDLEQHSGEHPLFEGIGGGLTSLGLFTTIYKPLSEFSFLLIQAGADMNGNFRFPEFQDLRYNRYNGAVVWGRRPNDNTQWGIGLARTYRAGELNYIPVVMLNRTSISRKWGVEMLFPARGHVRYTANLQNLFFAGFELEGNSYRISNDIALAEPWDELELRRSELRFRLMYQRKLIGFFWLETQVGARVNYSYNVDSVPNGVDFFRGFFGDQPFAYQNTIGNPFYANISINFVSP